jgi:hypothetical protein
MIRSLLASLLCFAAVGCATVSGTPAGSSSATSASHYDTMSSTPPEARKEDMPKLTEREVWVPGYYQPVAGSWVWHQGERRDAKEGYTLVPASYREEGGKVTFQPPRWRRADLAAQSASSAK